MKPPTWVTTVWNLLKYMTNFPRRNTEKCSLNLQTWWFIFGRHEIIGSEFMSQSKQIIWITRKEKRKQQKFGEFAFIRQHKSFITSWELMIVNSFAWMVRLRQRDSLITQMNKKIHNTPNFWRRMNSQKQSKSIMRNVNHNFRLIWRFIITTWRLERFQRARNSAELFSSSFFDFSLLTHAVEC